MSRINKKHLTSAILLAAFIALLPMQLVRASPISITSISPTNGPVGTVVTVVGEADTPGGLVMIYFDINGNGLIDYGEFGGSNYAYGYTFTVPILVPPSTAGTHAIIANDVDAGTSTGSDFTVTPQITFIPTSGSIGTVVTVTGTGFDPTSTITITFNGIDVTPTPAPVTNEVGSFTAEISVPPTIAGDHLITATDEAGNSNSGLYSFTLLPITVAIDPTSGPVGTNVDVTGKYATPKGIVTIVWDTGPIDTTIAEENGYYSYLLTVDPSTYGVHIIKAIDVESGNEAFEEFFVEPRIVLSVEEGVVGTEVTVTGTGFAGNAYVDITYNTDLVVDDFPTSNTGNFETTFSVPESVFDGHIVTATDTINPAITASATFKVGPEIHIKPTSGAVGTGVFIEGTGFDGPAQVFVYFDRDADGIRDPEDFIFDTSTNDYGSFSDDFTVPTSVYGDHIVTAITYGHLATATFTVDRAVITLVPEYGMVGQWVEVTGVGFSGESDVDVCFNGKLVLEAKTDEYGSFSGNFRVPWVTTAGSYLVRAIDLEGVYDEAYFTVVFVMYTRSNEYFQGDYPSFFIQSVYTTGWVYVEITIYDPEGYMQYYGYTWTVPPQGTVPYDMQFWGYYTGVLSAFHLPSDATVGTWTWKGYEDYYGYSISGSFEVVERVDLRILLEKLDQLLKGQEDIVGWIVFYGEKLQLGHRDLALLISEVAEALHYDHEQLYDLVADVADRLSMEHEALADLIADVKTQLSMKISDVADLIVTVADKLQMEHEDLCDLIMGVAEKLQMEHEDIVTLIGEVLSNLSDVREDLESLESLIANVGARLDAGVEDILALIATVSNKLQLEHDEIVTLVENVFADLQITIDEAKADILASIAEATDKLQLEHEELADLVSAVFEALEIKLDDIKSEIVGIKEKVDGLYLVIGNLEVKLDDINAKLTNVQGRITTIETDIGTIKTDIGKINGKIVAIEGRLATIETDIGTIKTGVNDIQAELVDVNGVLATINTALGRVETKIDNIGAVSLEEIKNDIATIKSDIGTIKVNVSNINANITSIKGRLVTIETTVGTIQADIDDINGKIVAIEDETATIKTDVGTVKTSLTDINTKIKVTNDNVATIQTDIGTIKGRLTTIEGDVATIETEIGIVKTSTSNIEKTGESIKSDTSLQPTTVALSLIAAIAAIAAAAMVLRKVYMK